MMSKRRKKICDKCNGNEHEQCVTRDMTSVKDCGCGCVGNPFLGICCVNIPKETAPIKPEESETKHC
jgi:hypothetical protein